MRSVSLHFFPTKLFSPQCRPRSCSRGACCVCCGCQDGTGSTAQPRLSTPHWGSRLRTLNIPPHPLVNSACAPPHLPLFKSRATLLPNPSQSIQVNCSGVGSRELPPDHCRHIWAVVARSLQAANLMPLLPQSIKDVKKERDAKEPSYTDQPTPVIPIHYNPFQSPCFCITK